MYIYHIYIYIHTYTYTYSVRVSIYLYLSLYVCIYIYIYIYIGLFLKPDVAESGRADPSAGDAGAVGDSWSARLEALRAGLWFYDALA